MFLLPIIIVVVLAILRSIGQAEDLYVNVNGQKLLFVDPEKDLWMNALSLGLDRLKAQENVLDYGLGRYYIEVYDRSLQRHVRKSIYGVLVLTNLRLILLRRKRRASFSSEYDYSQAITIPIALTKYTDCDGKMLRIGTLKTARGRKIHHFDFEVESPELASIMEKQIQELVVQYKAIERMEKRKKRKKEIVMVPLKCPKCQGELLPTETKNVFECKFCGTTVMIKS